MKRYLYQSVVIALVGIWSVTVHAGEHSKYASDRVSFQQNGLARTSLPILTIKELPENRATPQALLKALQVNSTGLQETKKDDLIEYTNNEDWALTISKDGTFVDFRKNSDSSRQSLSRADWSDAQIFDHAMSLVETKLSPLLPLAADEKIVPLKTSRGVLFTTDRRTGVTQKKTVSYMAHLGRQKGDVYILAGGSSVYLEFSPAGDLLRLTYDWPVYETPKTVAMLIGKEAFFQKKAAIVEKQARILGITTSEKHHESLVCGYFDPGYERREANQKVQPVCLQEIKNTESKRGSVSIIPLAESPIPDKLFGVDGSGGGTGVCD